MEIYIILLKAMLSLVLTAINIIEFFLLVRAVMLFKEVAWLKPFDTTGKALAVNFMTRIDGMFYRIRSRRLSEKGRIFVGLVVLELIKLLIGGTY